MNTTVTLLDLAGSVALLLWGMHMIQSGIQRAFGANLRRFLGKALSNRAKAFMVGLGTTTILQSSTATGLIIASFAAEGLVDLVPALAAMLGANVGTTLIVQILSFDVSSAAPICILIGSLMFRRSSSGRLRDLGRVAIGFGLMLVALVRLLSAITPYDNAPELRLLLDAIVGDPVIATIIGGLLTWATHSSVAIVLLVMSLAGKGLVSLPVALALVLGANLGTAINPLLEGTARTDPAARRLPMGNLFNRIIGCGMMLPFLSSISHWQQMMGIGEAQDVAAFHLCFNIFMAALFFPFLSPFAAILCRLLPDSPEPADPGKPLYLDRGAIGNPPVALANAERESLRMVDALDMMLHAALGAIDRGERQRVEEAQNIDDVLDRLNAAIKSYLISIDPEGLGSSGQKRLSEILAFATNLEHAGDVITKSLMPIAAKRLKQNLSFSVEGQMEMRAMLERLCGNLRTASAVFMTEDMKTARTLFAEKSIFREMEMRATEAHFSRLRAGRIESVETSALHMDILRDLKRVNGHIAATAYPVLEAHGEFAHTRLASDDPPANGLLAAASEPETVPEV